MAGIDIFNMLMIVGLICLVIAIVRIDNDLKRLRERNLRLRQIDQSDL